ncbi:MAG: peptidoglycan-associated lipoprotein Pal [Burkholderiales bacterium]
MKKLTIAVSMLFLLVACESTPLDVNKVPIEDRSGAGGAGTAQAGAGAQTGVVQPQPQVTTVTSDSRGDASANEALTKRSIYFDLDSDAVREDSKPVVQAHARYLAANPSIRAIIQGNTDERGSREYNLALGQRRSEAVKKLLNVLGANNAQMEAVSFGEEKPRAQGHDETAWAENRRVDIQYGGQ